jgi:transcriptional regulator with XRE-family HTH domain
LTRERAAERLDWSLSKMSRIESGTTPYSEDDLFAAAEVYQCTPSDLIGVNPLKEGEVVDLLGLLHDASPNARRAALAMLKELKTGTNGE